MKISSAFYILILGLTLSARLFATEHNESHEPEMCSNEKDASCADSTSSSKAEHHGKAKDWTHERLTQVAAVLPQPTQDKSKADKPETVKLTSPKFLSSINGTEAKLEWTKSENAKLYHVQVSKDAGFNNRAMYVLNNNAVTETTIDVKNLEPNTKYFWRVAASNGDLKDGFTKSNFVTSEFTTK